MRTIPGRCRFLLAPRIHRFDDEKDHEGDDQKVHNVVDKCPVRDYRNALRLRIRDRNGGAFRMIQHPKQARKIYLAEEQANGRHNHAFNERGDDFAKGGPDNDGNGEVKYVTARDEVSKFFYHELLSFGVAIHRLMVRHAHFDLLFTGRTWPACNYSVPRL